MRVSTKDLKKGVTYYLNYEYVGWGGEPVKYFCTLKSPLHHKGSVIVRNSSGVEFLVHKNSFLFGEPVEKQE